MSAPYFAGLPSPNKKVELVKKITERTREGKIVWQKTANGAAAYVPGAMKMNFVDAPWAGLFTTRWVIFAVRDEVGNELLKVENQTSGVSSSNPLLLGDIEPGLAGGLSTLAGILASVDPLVGPVTELHTIVQRQIGTEGVDRAIDILDKM